MAIAEESGFCKNHTEPSSREKWLNGWSRKGETVLIGCGIHCAGCGRSFGITTVMFEDDYVRPEKDPDWPFEESTCPVCQQEENHHARMETEARVRASRFAYFSKP